MPTTKIENAEIRRQFARRSANPASSMAVRIGSGVALASHGTKKLWKDNPSHWQTLILLLPLFHNPDCHGHRQPIAPLLLNRTVHEMQHFFSGFTVTHATGWYWNEKDKTGVPDELIRFEVDGVFTGSDLCLLHEWKEKLRRRFRQDYIYMRLVPSGVAI